MPTVNKMGNNNDDSDDNDDDNNNNKIIIIIITINGHSYNFILICNWTINNTEKTIYILIDWFYCPLFYSISVC